MVHGEGGIRMVNPPGVKTTRGDCINKDGNAGRRACEMWRKMIGEQGHRIFWSRASQAQLHVVVEVDSLLAGNLASDVETGPHRTLGDQVDCSHNDLVQSVWERILPRGAFILYVDSR